MCHTAGSPLTLTNCTSCHVQPPDGSVYPNIAGTHLTAHALPGITEVCNVCHNGLGTNTWNHYNRANGRPGAGGRVPPGDVAFLATYNAKTGAASFNSSALTCANVSFHGGQTTPNWRTGTIDVNTQCTSCHAYGTSQFNSYNSGRHNLEEHRSRACTDCHNTTTLAVNHFNALGTSAMEGPASATVGGGSTRVRSYNAGSCSTTCHETKRWQGGD
jgi:predicted CxxxxCH...CXXCH cytochrome family protein